MKNIFIDSIFCIIETVIILYFIDSTFTRKKTESFTLTPSFLILLSADIAVSFFHIPTYIQVIMLFVLCEIVLLAFYKGKIFRKIYTGITTVMLIIFPSLLTFYIVSWVSGIEFLVLISHNGSLRILLNISIKLLQFITVKTVAKFHNKEKSHISKYKIFIYSVAIMISIFSIVKIRDGLLNGYMNSVYSTYITAIIIIIDLCIYLIIYYYSESNQRKLDIEMQKLTIQQQQKDIENIIHDYYETLKIRHDIKKYLSIAIEMINQKEYEQLKEYLYSFQGNKLGNVKTYINTQNKMFNAIINQKLCEAEKAGIKIECFIFDDLSDFSGMDNLELCLIFLNLLDNAIEAERNVDMPIIKLNIFQNAGYNCFKIENIVDNDVLSANPTLKTTKTNNRIHGIGLRSVREIIDNHDGIFNITQNEKWFSVEIMLLKSEN